MEGQAPACPPAAGRTHRAGTRERAPPAPRSALGHRGGASSRLPVGACPSWARWNGGEFELDTSKVLVRSIDMPEEKDPSERRYPAHQTWRRRGNRSTIVFATVCTKDRRPLLADPSIHKILIEAWRVADSWLVGRYVILPDHIHLFASPRELDSPDIRKWIAYWKSMTTKAWPDGASRPIWQRDAWDRELRSGESYSAKWEYVRKNPVRHGLVDRADDWPYQGELHSLMWHD